MLFRHEGNKLLQDHVLKALVKLILGLKLVKLILGLSSGYGSSSCKIQAAGLSSGYGSSSCKIQAAGLSSGYGLKLKLLV